MEKPAEPHPARQPTPISSFLATLSIVEIVAGVLIMVWTFGGVILRRFGIGPELHGIWGLTPLLFSWCGITLVLAGAGIRKYPVFPYVMHIPLVIWLVVVAFALA